MLLKILILLIIAGCVFFWFVFRKKAEDEPDEKFVCPHCNEKDCNCYKEEDLQGKDL